MSNFYSRRRRIPIAAVVTLLRITDGKTAQPMEKLYFLCTGPIVLATTRWGSSRAVTEEMMETRLRAQYDYHLSRGAVLMRLLKIEDTLSI